MSKPLDLSPTGRSRVETAFGSIALVDIGDGPVTLFLHGLGQSAYFWRNQLREFSATRRCLAIDLMAHGYTEALPGADVSFREQAKMVLAVLEALKTDTVDVVSNDSGGAIAQILAVTAPQRVRSLVFTNCDVHDNWPPPKLHDIREVAKAGRFADMLGAMMNDLGAFRAGLGRLVYEDPAFVTDEAARANVGPIVSSPERKAAYHRYIVAQDHDQLVVIEAELRRLAIPSLIVWGTGDPFFPVVWAHWLKAALPAARDIIEIEGAMLFFPEEKPERFNPHVAAFWASLT
jgi:pimeloyl-ACP methyl ester carboxylesterase